MKRFFMCALAAAIMALLPSLAISAGPETINLKEKFDVTGSKKAVIFPHHKHQEKLACTKCHASPEGGKLNMEIKKKEGFGNDFHKKFCWPCHVEMKVPKGKSCSTCHK